MTRTELTERGKQIRKALQGHNGNSCVEILLALYGDVMKQGEGLVLVSNHAGPPHDVITKARGSDPFLKLRSTRQGDAFPSAVSMITANPGERLFALIPKSECYMGSTWESLLAGGNERSVKLTVIVDWTAGPVSNLNRALPEAAFAAGWHVTIVDGHSIPALTEVLAKSYPRPHLVIARTEENRES